MPHQPTWQTPASPGIQGLHGAANLLKGIAAGIPASNLSTATWPTTQLGQPAMQQHQQATIYQTTQPQAPQYYIQAPSNVDQMQQGQPSYTMQAPYATMPTPAPFAMMPASLPYAMTMPAPGGYMTMQQAPTGYVVNGGSSIPQQTTNPAAPQAAPGVAAPTMQMTSNGQTFYWMQPPPAQPQQPQQQQGGSSTTQQAV